MIAIPSSQTAVLIARGADAGMSAAHPLPRERARGLIFIVAAFALAHVLLWGVGFSLAHSSPHVDGAEQLVWSYALQAGYWKHPPLSSWILHALVSVFGPSVTLTYVAAQACAVIALVLGWRLGCAFMSPERSLVAMVLTALVGYQNFNAQAFNHNTALMPFQAAMTLLFHRAVRHGGWGAWAATGLMAGLAMMVKYVALFPIACLLAYLALDRSTHVRRTALGVLLAAAVALTVSIPHALWLQGNDFLPVAYMRSVTHPVAGFSEDLANVANFLQVQLLRLLPFLVVLVLLARAGRKSPRLREHAPASQDRLFLWVAGAGPLVLLVLYALATRTPLLNRWGSHCFLLAGWLAADLLRNSRMPAHRTAVRIAGGMYLLVWSIATIVAPRVAGLLDLRYARPFPGAEIAQRAEATWRSQSDRRLPLLVTDTWLGGNVIAKTRPLPVLVDGQAERAPWVTAQDVAACGALVLLDRSREHDPDTQHLREWLAQASWQGQWVIPWERERSRREPVRIAWGILPAADSASCRFD